MIISDIFRYLKGEIRFRVEGMAGDRLLSACAREEIPLWDIVGKELEFEATAEIRDYKRIAPLARRYGMRVSLKKRRGFPFFLYKRRKRYGILLGMVLFFLTLFLFSSRIWSIEVRGNQITPTEVILENLEKAGVYIGASGRGWDALDLEKDMLLRMHGISSILVNFRGSTVEVEVNERTHPPQRLDRDKEPANVVATHTGQIVSIQVFDGESTVKEGDAVEKGEMLISGVFEGKNGKTHLRNGRGKIIADVEETIVSEICFAQTDYRDTGKTSTLRFFRVGKKEFPLNPLWEDTPIYRIEENRRGVTLLGIPLPLEMGVRQYFYMEPQEITLSMEEAKALCLKALEEEEHARFRDAEIISKNPVSRVEQDRYLIQCNYVVRREISKQIPIQTE